MAKEKVDKALLEDYQYAIIKETESYYRMATSTKYLLDSPRPYWHDVIETLKNLWQKEQMIIALRGTIYNNL